MVTQSHHHTLSGEDGGTVLAAGEGQQKGPRRLVFTRRRGLDRRQAGGWELGLFTGAFEPKHMSP